MVVLLTKTLTGIPCLKEAGLDLALTYSIPFYEFENRLRAVRGEGFRAG